MRYPIIYDLLKRAGHSPAKAIEIILDAKRGDAHAMVWIRLIAETKAITGDKS